MAVTESAVEASAVTLSVEEVHVVHRPRESSRSLRESLFEARHREIYALRGVTFQLSAGEVLGVVGSNGSGKSTLLRSIAGLVPLESGRIRATSMPTLLGIGPALKPALSGRRNIFIGGLAMGLDRRSLEERFDEIVEFSGLRDVIDLPMRAYSSGMRARLLFSLSTALRPDLLLIDEALAVGDTSFRQRSHQRLIEGLVAFSIGSVPISGSTCPRIFEPDPSPRGPDRY